MGFAAMLRSHPGTLGFGFLHAFASSAGQTFVIALFLPGIKASFQLGDGEVASLYAAATVVSAGALWLVGRWIDRVDLVQYSLLSGLLLAIACLLTASSTWVSLLAIGFFALRLGGQGLLSHVGVTAIARYFKEDRGKALSLTSMGHSLGEAALPVIIVTLIAAWGWRPAMVAAGVFSLLIIIVADALVRKNPAFRKPRMAIVWTTQAAAQVAAKVEVQVAAQVGAQAPAPGRPEIEPDFLRSRYFLMSTPLLVAPPMFITALIFHQALIAQENGFSLEWFAVSFVAFAVARVVAGFLIGPWVDHTGARKLFPLHVLPLCVGIAILVLGTATWVVPVYWVFAGITSGMAGTLQAAMVAEHVKPNRIGGVRGFIAAMMILATAAGPVIFAWLTGAGLTLSSVLWGTVAAIGLATILSLAVTAMPPAGAQQPG